MTRLGLTNDRINETTASDASRIEKLAEPFLAPIQTLLDEVNGRAKARTRSDDGDWPRRSSETASRLLRAVERRSDSQSPMRLFAPALHLSKTGCVLGHERADQAP
jgi:hypothetical protein